MSIRDLLVSAVPVADPEPTPPRQPIGRRQRVAAYLRRFFTSWVAEDPAPEHSRLDRLDGLR